MIPMQISAKDGMERAFQSNPAKAAMAADARMRLMMPAIGDRVKGHKGNGETDYCREQANQAASIEYALAHGLKHTTALAEVQDA